LRARVREGGDGLVCKVDPDAAVNGRCRKIACVAGLGGFNGAAPADEEGCGRARDRADVGRGGSKADCQAGRGGGREAYGGDRIVSGDGGEGNGLR
jgi:hypothetical protein